MTHHLRIARPVSDLARTQAMYGEALGLTVISHFEDHAGFSGVMLGDPAAAYHFEFTTCATHSVTPAPTAEDLIVLYLPDAAEWRQVCNRMLQAGFKQVESFNPYWDQRGQTFEDLDGYRLVLQNAAWHNAIET